MYLQCERTMAGIDSLLGSGDLFPNMKFVRLDWLCTLFPNQTFPAAETRKAIVIANRWQKNQLNNDLLFLLWWVCISVPWWLWLHLLCNHSIVWSNVRLSLVWSQAKWVHLMAVWQARVLKTKINKILIWVISKRLAN